LSSGDEKLEQIKDGRNNFEDIEGISKILKVTLQQSLAMPDKAKYDPWY